MNQKHIHDTIRPIRWRQGHLQLLDQRRLPRFEKWLDIPDLDHAVRAITDLVVRGAPAIGITAAYAAVLAARARYRADSGNWRESFENDLDRLQEARPTAVNLCWAVRRMREAARGMEGDPEPELTALANAIMEADIDGNRRMGRWGADLLAPDSGVLTHCNTGSLATGGFGTALGIIRSAAAEGRIRRVFAGETRPWLQGSRLTAWELARDGIGVELIADSAGAHLMASGEVQAVIVGADRVAANGDVANKIGTYSLAVAARHHGIPFIVAAPVSTIDTETRHGGDIPIEHRDGGELLGLAGHGIAAQGARAFNPVFDITPADLVSHLVTERGVVHSPKLTSIAAHLAGPAKGSSR